MTQNHSNFAILSDTQLHNTDAPYISMAHLTVHIPDDVGILSFGAAVLDGISARDYNVNIQAKVVK